MTIQYQRRTHVELAEAEVVIEVDRTDAHVHLSIDLGDGKPLHVSVLHGSNLEALRVLCNALDEAVQAAHTVQSQREMSALRARGMPLIDNGDLVRSP
jgi:hypothetical protein